MLFNSFDFIVFLPVVFALHWLLPFKYRWIVLLLASYYFYMSWSKKFALLLLATTAIDYYIALKISGTEDAHKKKQWLLFSLISNLGCLFGFKYFVFFYNSSVSALGHYSLMQEIILPVGLSFYTFQSLSYTIDVYRGFVQPEKSLPRFALFVSFFPQLVAGPVERFSHLMPQFYEKRKLLLNNLIIGVRIASWGFFKKMVIADRLAGFVDPVFADVYNFQPLTLLICSFFFIVQIYCDFSGYSDIATGVAKLFGYDLMLNWRRPLLSASLTEFWKRNHISMTTWFRDYLYKPLGGSRCTEKRWLINLFLVFLISGLWHGANWTFVVWGAMHGIVFVAESFIKKHFPYLKAPRFFGWIYLMIFYTFSMMAFRAHNLSDLLLIYKQVFSFDFNFIVAFNELRKAGNIFPLFLSLVFIAFLFLKELNEEFAFVNKIKGYEQIWKPAFYVMIFMMIFMFGVFNSDEFLYFRF